MKGWIITNREKCEISIARSIGTFVGLDTLESNVHFVAEIWKIFSIRFGRLAIIFQKATCQNVQRPTVRCDTNF